MNCDLSFVIRDQKLWRFYTTDKLPAPLLFDVTDIAIKINKPKRLIFDQKTTCLCCGEPAKIEMVINDTEIPLCYDHTEPESGPFAAKEIRDGVYLTEVIHNRSPKVNVIADTNYKNFRIEEELCRMNEVTQYVEFNRGDYCVVCNNYGLCDCKMNTFCYVVDQLVMYKLLLAALVCDDVAAKIVIIWYNLQ